MELHTIRGGNKKSLEAKEYIISIGISLGSRWFSQENVIELITWSLRYSRGQVVVFVADSIHAINLEVRNDIPYERALRRVKEKGTEILSSLQAKAKEVFVKEDLDRIVFGVWDDFTDHQYKEKVKYLYELYESDSEFKVAIVEIVRNWASKEDRVFSEKDIIKLGTYILEELPEITSRVPFKGIVCDAYAYPNDDLLTQFAEKLQAGALFPNIKKDILTTSPKVFLEVR